MSEDWKVKWSRVDSARAGRRRANASAPKCATCGTKAHGIVVSAPEGTQGTEDLVRTPYCKTHLPTGTQGAISVYKKSDNDPLGTYEATSEQRYADELPAPVGPATTVPKPDDSIQTIGKVAVPHVLNRRTMEIYKTTEAARGEGYGKSATELGIGRIAGTERHRTIDSHIEALNDQHDMVKAMLEYGDNEGLQDHVNDTIKRFEGTNGDMSKLTHADRAILNSLDNTDQLDWKKFTRYTKKSINNLKSNQVVRSPARNKNLFIGRPEVEPAQPYREVDTSGLDVGEIETVRKRPDVVELSRDEEFQKKVRAGHKRGGKTQAKGGKVTKVRRNQGPVADIIALRKAALSGEAFGGQPISFSQKEAKSHLTYNRQLRKHVAGGGSEETFLDRFTDTGRAKRGVVSTGRVERDGRKVKITELKTVMPRAKKKKAKVVNRGKNSR